MTRPWRASPYLRFSFWLHIASFLPLFVQPALWPWVVAGLVLNHFVIVFAGLWPHSSLLGPNIRRLPAASVARNEIALTFDDGPDPEITPQVLAILQQHGVRATFFCLGKKLAAHPELAVALLAQGHSLGNHTDAHPLNFSVMGPGQTRREVLRAQDCIEQLSGRKANFFRAPAGLRNVFLDAILHAAGLRLVSWTRRGFDTRERDPVKVLARLTHNLAAGDILLLHDAGCARTANGAPVVLAVLPTLLDQIAARRLQAVTLDEAFNKHNDAREDG